MKRALLFITLTLGAFSSFGQQRNDTIFYNKAWKPSGKDSALYYRTGTTFHNGLFYVTDRYINGQIQMKGTLKSMSPDVNDGSFIFYDSAGMPTAKEQYRNGVLNGVTYTFYRGSLKIKDEVRYTNGKRDGISFDYDSVTAKVVGIYHYKNGRSVDTSRKYNSSGKLMFEIIPAPDGLRQITSYDMHGNKRRQSYIDTNGKKTGPYTVYYPGSDIIMAEGSYKSDSLDGAFTKYDFSCHLPLKKGQYKLDKAYGIWKEFSVCDTAVVNVWAMANGENEGTSQKFDPKTKTLVIIGEVINGKEEGEWKYYFRGTHNLCMIRHYKHGFLDGKLTTFYPNGKIRREEEYAQGTLTKWKCFGINGADTMYYKRFVQAVLADNFQSLIARQIRYPKAAYDARLEGKVIVKLRIDNDGRILATSIVQSSDKIFDAEALRVAEMIPVMSPALDEGEPINTSIYVTIPFSPDANSPDITSE